MKKIIIFFSILSLLLVGGIFTIGETSGKVLNTKVIKTATDLKEKCNKDSSCYQSSLIIYMNAKGVPATVKMIAATSKITNGLNNDCHNISHRMGQEAFKLIGKEALTLHENSCQWGFGHGVLIAASDKLAAEEFVDAFKDFCAVDPEPIGCLHGIGHALGGKKTDPKLSQDICYNIATEIDARKPRDIASKSSAGACVEGWMMQQLGSLPYNSYTRFAQVIEPCESMTEEALAICNGMSIRNYVDIAVDQAGKSSRLVEFYKYCNKISDKMVGYECGRYLAEAADDVSVPDSNFNVSGVGKSIDFFCDNQWADACTTSYTNYQINRNESDPANMLAVCKIIKKKLQDFCYNSISKRTNRPVAELKS